jgi:hypothetical protein
MLEDDIDDLASLIVGEPCELPGATTQRIRLSSTLPSLLKGVERAFRTPLTGDVIRAPWQWEVSFLGQSVVIRERVCRSVARRLAAS